MLVQRSKSILLNVISVKGMMSHSSFDLLVIAMTFAALDLERYTLKQSREYPLAD